MVKTAQGFPEAFLAAKPACRPRWELLFRFRNQNAKKKRHHGLFVHSAFAVFLMFAL